VNCIAIKNSSGKAKRCLISIPFQNTKRSRQTDGDVTNAPRPSEMLVPFSLPHCAVLKPFHENDADDNQHDPHDPPQADRLLLSDKDIVVLQKNAIAIWPATIRLNANPGPSFGNTRITIVS